MPKKLSAADIRAMEIRLLQYGESDDVHIAKCHLCDSIGRVRTGEVAKCTSCSHWTCGKLCGYIEFPLSPAAMLSKLCTNCWMENQEEEDHDREA